MNDSIIAAILFIIKYKRDISDIFAYGIHIEEIQNILKYIQTKGYCIKDKNHYYISELGEKFIQTHSNLFTKKRIKVNPLFERRLPRQSVNDIYLPTLPPDL